MFNSQRKAGGSVPPPQPCATNDTQAKEKLQGYVYEYLLLSGATKTAESFKNEALTNFKHITTTDPPGFLQNWWLVFWDLYSAAPDRRDSCEATQEAKAFHEYGFIPPTFVPPPGSMVNGIHGAQNAPGGGPMMGADGMPMGPGYFPPRGAPGGPPSQSNQASPISGHPPGQPGYGGVRYGAPPGRGGTPGMPPNAQPGMAFGPPGGPQPPPHMFQDNNMRPMGAQRLPPNAMRMPGPAGFAGPGPGMRSNTPGRYATQMHYIDSPGGTPFPQGAMMSNGAICTSASLMNSPGPMIDGQPDPRFMMGTSSMPFMGEGGAPPVGEIMINGEDMKQSPASSTHGGLNGGTPGPVQGPGSQQAPGGPGSAAPRPTSASGGPGSAHSGGGAGPTNGAEPMDYQQQSAGGGAPLQYADGRSNEQSEIAKIKQSMMEDFSVHREEANDYNFP